MAKVIRLCLDNSIDLRGKNKVNSFNNLTDVYTLLLPQLLMLFKLLACYIFWTRKNDIS